jgi:hypothetical protein
MGIAQKAQNKLPDHRSRHAYLLPFCGKWGIDQFLHSNNKPQGQKTSF